MVTPATQALVAALATATAMALLVRPVLHRLPRAAGAPDYRALGTTGFVLTCVALAGLAGAAAWLSQPVAAQPLWAVLAVLGVLLAAIDARTTWLPLRLTRLAWAAMAVAAGLALPLGADLALLLRAGLGALLAGLLYLALWRVSRGGFGFGDVRFAPLLGATTAATSWTLLLWALTLGSVVGALHGLVRLAGRRTGGFPYAPAMLAGAYAAGLCWWLRP